MHRPSGRDVRGRFRSARARQVAAGEVDLTEWDGQGGGIPVELWPAGAFADARGALISHAPAQQYSRNIFGNKWIEFPHPGTRATLSPQKGIRALA